MNLNKAEIQILASLRRAELKGERSDKATLERSRQRYWMFCEELVVRHLWALQPSGIDGR